MKTSPRFSVCAFLIVLIVAVLPAAAAAAPADNPPPIPTLESRDAFIRSHQAGLELQDPAQASRGAHDEYDVTHYDVDLHFDIPARVITGAVDVHATALVADLSTVVLDLYSPMVVDGVTVDGTPAAYTHTAGMITVTLGSVLQPGDSVSVRCAYHGTPNYTGSPFRWNTHGVQVPMVLSYSEPHGAPAWWVCKDDPKDKATFAIHVTAPDTLVTVSNGSLRSTVNNGDGTATCNWVTNYPMSSYLFCIATTNFQSWTEVYTALDHVRTMNVDYYAYPEEMAQAQVSWSRNVEMMHYYASIFGEYPFLSEKYAIAEFEHPGAMEHQTVTSMGAVWVDGTHTNDDVVVHELAHSWVGDMITMREWSHAWTKEGFATLCEALWFESLYGINYYHTYMNGLPVMTYANLQLYNINPPLSAAIYYKGAWVLHMLRHIIGDHAFFAGMYGYTNDPALMYGVSDTETLRQAFEASSGLDLTWFFDEWIYHPGYPHYATIWQAAPAGGGYDVSLFLTQTQTIGPIFKMPIDVRVDTNLGREYFVVQDSLRVQSFVLHVAGTPSNVVLDPDGWLIKAVASGTDVAEGEPGVNQPGVWSGPNPFSGSTTVRFSLPAPGTARLRVYDISGRLVRTLFQGSSGAGPRQVAWDGRGDDGSTLPSGVYFQRLDAGVGTWEARTTLVR
jgi:aminopeptidase N